jgi:fatty acid desaturase
MSDATRNMNVRGVTDEEKAIRIKRVIVESGQDLRRRFPILLHQDAIGVSILAFSLIGMISCAALYYCGLISAWLCIPLIALFASFTHELEHDLIHYIYFPKRPLAHNLMMLFGWIARPSTINPWLRRRIHIYHHQHSGTEDDVEERGITNGERWGLRRFLMTGDGIMAVLFGLRHLPDWKARAVRVAHALVVYFPLGWIHWGLWYCFLGFHLMNFGARLVGSEIMWSAATLKFMSAVNFMTVVWFAPNMLRSFCLHFVSSNIHYYGDIEDGNIIQQTQVMNAWWMIPFQLFCFNFGSTHAIHHFVVKDPFYIRQMIASDAHKIMREMGVRFNDSDTFFRANHYQADKG